MGETQERKGINDRAFDVWNLRTSGLQLCVLLFYWSALLAGQIQMSSE